jgi:O-acetyl-ADP-ribose deacetylase (regulator of RNase III)
LETKTTHGTIAPAPAKISATLGEFVLPAKHDYWTNPSVKVLVEGTGNDPTSVITQKAVSVVLGAMQQGWTGPPFDPFRLADLLNVRVIPREDVSDARTVPSGSGLTVEFNPNRPKSRVRYSICHELAHTLFPDCRERVRNRLTHASMKGDDWQLEMLCNIAAAEFAMPLGSLPQITEEHLDIDHALTLRQTYAVSAEAMLLRMVKLTKDQCSFFSASPIHFSGRAKHRYAIDYARPSKTWMNTTLPYGSELPSDTVAAECTAIGFTARGQEQWPAVGKVKVECVGVSPYPNHVYPRVIGLLKPPRQAPVQLPSITYLKGDASEPRGSGNRLLVQVVNDSALTWGGGFSLALRKKWPTLQQAFRSWAMQGRNLKLGNVHVAAANEALTVVSMVAQHGYGPSPKPRIRYLALQKCLRTVGELARQRDATVHMPRIGCGLAGGSWSVVHELVTEEICNKGVSVSVYDLPGVQPQGHPQAALQF